MIFSNKTESDIILREEWEAMTGLDLWLLVTDEENSSLHHPMLDQEALKKRFPNAASLRFYLCGPMGMTEALTKALEGLGASPDSLVFEQ